MEVYGTNTRIEQSRWVSFRRATNWRSISGACWLTPQQYTLTVWRIPTSSHDWLDDAIAFDVVDTRVAAGVANLRAKIEWRVSR
jgi:hypothetical protein